MAISQRRKFARHHQRLPKSTDARREEGGINAEDTDRRTVGSTIDVLRGDVDRKIANGAIARSHAATDSQFVDKRVG